MNAGCIPRFCLQAGSDFLMTVETEESRRAGRNGMAAHAPGRTVQAVMRSGERPGRDLRMQWGSKQPNTSSMIASTNSQKIHQGRGTQNHASAGEGVAVCGFCTSPFGVFNSIPWRLILCVHSHCRGSSIFRVINANRRSLLWLAREPHLAVQLRYCTCVAIPGGSGLSRREELLEGGEFAQKRLGG